MFCFLGIIRNTHGFELAPNWFLFALLGEVVVYVIYISVQKYIILSHRIANKLLFFLHDISLIAIILLIINFEKYLFPSVCAIYYVFFFFIVIKRRMREEKIDTGSVIVRTELPRRCIDELND